MILRFFRGALLGLALVCVGAPARAADDAEGVLEAARENLGESQLSSLGNNADALLAVAAIEAGEMVRARELAESLLAADPNSVEGHCALGLVMGEAEGNLPGSAHYLERCLELFEAQYGWPGDDTPWFWHWTALDNLAQVKGDMGQRDEAFEVVERIESIYSDDGRYRTSWWHYRAGRYDQARQQALEIIADANSPEERVYGWNVLCAVEGDLGNLIAMYDACKASIADDRGDGFIDPVQLTNAAEAARALLLADEAEELMLEATEHFHRRGVSIPWSELVLFYTNQARLAEAVSALREAQRWRRRQDAYVGALTWALQDVNAAHLMLVGGRPDVAADLTRRSLERSDRYGRISTAKDEREGWASLLERAVHLTLAEQLEEEASWSPWREALSKRFDALGHRLRAWQAGRRVVANFAKERLLRSRLIPHASGRVPMPEWLELDLVELLGPGVIEVALRRLEVEPPPEQLDAYTMAYAAESARVDGRPLESLDRVQLALERLPKWERLMRARLATTAAEAALDAGNPAVAAGFFDEAWQIDPGVIRRRGLALPTRFVSSGGPAAAAALALLEGSPRFAAAERGFEVRVEGQGEQLLACLHGTHGAVLRCVDATGDDEATPPERLARKLHEQAFAPRVDLTQMDIRSLDGSNVVSGGEDPRIRFGLDDLIVPQSGENDEP